MKTKTPLTAAEIEETCESVHEAITTIAEQFDHLPPPKIFLTPESSTAEVVAYLVRFGRDHLNEMATGLRHDMNFCSRPEFDLVADVNGGAGHGGIFLAMLGLAQNVLVIDIADAAGEVAAQLGNLLSIPVQYCDANDIQRTARSSDFDSLLILASHAQHVNFARGISEQEALRIQNHNVMVALKELVQPDVLAAISLEPVRGQYGLETLLKPWSKNADAFESRWTNLPVAKFGRGLSIGHKRYESTLAVLRNRNSVDNEGGSK
jgi:hypothetical protein